MLEENRPVLKKHTSDRKLSIKFKRMRQGNFFFARYKKDELELIHEQGNNI